MKARASGLLFFYHIGHIELIATHSGGLTVFYVIYVNYVFYMVKYNVS